MKGKLLLAGSLFSVALSNAQVYIPDSLFADDSRLVLSPGAGDELTQLLVQDDGKIIVSGFDYDIGVNAYFIDMVRIDVCGNPDLSFGDSGVVRHTFEQRNTAYGFALQDDGKILSVGIQAPSNFGSQQIPYVARFNTDGSPDTTFGTLGSNSLRFDGVSSGNFSSVYQMDDGRIVAIGRSSGNINGGVNGVGAMRFNADGTLDTSFDGDGKTRYDGINPHTVVLGHLTPSGKIVSASNYYDGSFILHFASVAFDSSGVLDTTYATGGVFLDSVALTGRAYSAMQSDGKILIASQRDPASDGIELIRLNTDGSLDATYGVNGHINFNIADVSVTGLKMFSGDSLMVLAQINPPSEGLAILLTPDGFVDSTFGSNGIHIFNLTAGTSGHGLTDIIEVPGGRYIGGGFAGDFFLRRFSLQSNVPHIAYVHPNLVTAPQSSHQWFVDGVAIPGATTNLHDPVVVGNYTVEITDDLGCPYMSDTFAITNIGMSEVLQSPVSIYPNPVEGNLMVITDVNAVFAEVRDATGRIVFTQQLEGAEKTVLTETLLSGVYYINLFHDLKITTHKIIKL